MTQYTYCQGGKKLYCESTFICGVPIFVDFMGRPNLEIWFPTNKRFPMVCIQKTSKPRIQESTNLCFFPDPQNIIYIKYWEYFLNEIIICNIRFTALTKIIDQLIKYNLISYAELTLLLTATRNGFPSLTA